MAQDPKLEGQSGPKEPVDGSPDEPKTSSLAPVAAPQDPVPAMPPEPESPDLLPRVITVTLGAIIASLIAIYAIRQPPEPDASAAAQHDAEAVAGPSENQHLAWLAERSPDLAKLQTVQKSGDVGMRVGATAAGAGFDMVTSMNVFDAAQKQSAGCWGHTDANAVTVAVRFIPEGLAISADVEEREDVGLKASRCFERVFRRTSVPPFVGEETTLRRTMERP